MPLSSSLVIAQTAKWIQSVVIGCNFCPFASRAMLRKSIRYVVLPDATTESAMMTLVDEWHHLDRMEEVETTLVIFPGHFADFDAYLDLVGVAEDLSAEQGYEGVYQIASFHPDYCFAGATDDDPANYTNRSPYPMLHLLREDSITRALEHYTDAEGIPDRNMAFAAEKGLQFMQLLRASCLEIV